MNIGERIKTIRKELGYKQQEFAHMLGVSQSLISKFEQNSREMSYEALFALERMNINLNWIFTGKGNPYIPNRNNFQKDFSNYVQTEADGGDEESDEEEREELEIDVGKTAEYLQKNTDTIQKRLEKAREFLHSFGLKNNDGKPLSFNQLQKAGINLKWVYTGKGEMFLNEEEMNKTLNILTLPVYDTSIPCGNLSELLDAAPMFYIGLDLDQLNLPKEKYYIASTVKGDSMAPNILEGDIVVLEQQWQQWHAVNRVCAVRVGSEVTLKTVLYDDISGNITLQPANPNYEPLTFSPEQAAELELIGIVVYLIRDYRPNAPIYEKKENAKNRLSQHELQQSMRQIKQFKEQSMQKNKKDNK